MTLFQLLANRIDSHLATTTFTQSRKIDPAIISEFQGICYGTAGVQIFFKALFYKLAQHSSVGCEASRQMLISLSQFIFLSKAFRDENRLLLSDLLERNNGWIGSYQCVDIIYQLMSISGYKWEDAWEEGGTTRVTLEDNG